MTGMRTTAHYSTGDGSLNLRKNSTCLDDNMNKLQLTTTTTMSDLDQCNEETFGPKRDSIYVVVPLTVIYTIIFITGTIGNVSTCIVIAKNKSMHTATNYYLFSLSISDLLLLVTGLPQEVYLFWSRYPYIFGSTFCFLRGLFAETSGNATVLTITAFTVERYLAICHPFLSHAMSKLSRAVKIILGIWLLSVSLAVPQAMPLSVVGDCPQCVFQESDTVIAYAFEISTVLFFVAPMTLIIVLYVLIGVRLKSSRALKKRISTTARNQRKSSRKVIKMLVAVVVAFFICWAPFHIQRLYSMYFQKTGTATRYIHLKIYEVVTYISGVLYYLSATINPILYNIMSIKFREAFKETFARCCSYHHLNHNKPERSYSMLSKYNQRGAESTTDSGSHDHTVQTNTSSHKNSGPLYDSQTQQPMALTTASHHGKRCKPPGGLSMKGIDTTTAQHQLHFNLPLHTPNFPHPPLDRTSSPQPGPAYLSVQLRNGVASPNGRLEKFLALFRCVAAWKTLDESKRLSPYYSVSVREPNIFELQRTVNGADKDGFKRCESYHRPYISNSSLRDIETGAIEDELTTYMNELRQRELCS